MALPVKARASCHPMGVWQAHHQRFDLLSRTEQLPHETGTKVHINTTLIPPRRVASQAELLHQLPHLLPLRLPHVNARIAPPLHLPSVTGSGRTVSTWDPNPLQMTRSARKWTSRTAAEPLHHPTASHRPKYLAIVLKMLRTLDASMMAIIPLRPLTIRRLSLL